MPQVSIKRPPISHPDLAAWCRDLAESVRAIADAVEDLRRRVNQLENP